MICKTLKSLFLLATFFSSNIYSSEPSHPIDIKIGTLKGDKCQHQYCRQQRLNANAPIASKYKTEWEKFRKELEIYNKAKWIEYHPNAIWISAWYGVVATLVIVSRQKKLDLRPFSFFIKFIGSSIIVYMFASAFLKLALAIGSLEPSVSLTNECFIADSIEKINAYRAKLKSEIFWWQSFENSEPEMSAQFKAKFSGKKYPFTVALKNCTKLLEELKEVEDSARELLEPEITNDPNIQEIKLTSQEFDELKKSQEVLLTIQTTLKAAQELETEKLLIKKAIQEKGIRKK